MQLFLTTLLLGVAIVVVAGCDSPGGSGWKIQNSGTPQITKGSKTYGAYEGSRGDHVRGTVTAQPEAVNVRFYVVDRKGDEKNLGEQKDVKEFVKEADVPYDGTVMLEIHLKAGSKTSCSYKIEKR